VVSREALSAEPDAGLTQLCSDGRPVQAPPRRQLFHARAALVVGDELLHLLGRQAALRLAPPGWRMLLMTCRAR
jgi:hypothetical protein